MVSDSLKIPKTGAHEHRRLTHLTKIHFLQLRNPRKRIKLNRGESNNTKTSPRSNYLISNNFLWFKKKKNKWFGWMLEIRLEIAVQSTTVVYTWKLKPKQSLNHKVVRRGERNKAIRYEIWEELSNIAVFLYPELKGRCIQDLGANVLTKHNIQLSHSQRVEKNDYMALDTRGSTSIRIYAK